MSLSAAEKATMLVCPAYAAIKTAGFAFNHAKKVWNESSLTEKLMLGSPLSIIKHVEVLAKEVKEDPDNLFYVSPAASLLADATKETGKDTGNKEENTTYAIA